MQKNTCSPIVLCFVITLVSGCTTSPTQTNADTSTATVDSSDVRHIIAPGDRLSDIALKYTGMSGQWETIATYNNITDPRTLRIGDVIAIPAPMVAARKRPQSEHNNTSALNLKSGNSENLATATTIGTMALQKTRSNDIGATDVQVVSVRTNRSFQINPMDADKPNASQAPLSRSIKVVGTYYPKGVYQQPANYSKLIMRAAPGTIFELDGELNGWYKVITSEGVGYLRTADGKLSLED